MLKIKQIIRLFIVIFVTTATQQKARGAERASSIFSSVVNYADSEESLVQRAVNWGRAQEQKAYNNKLQRKAQYVVGGKAQQCNLSAHDRQQCQKIIMALHDLSQKPGNERLLLGLRERGGYGTYAFTELKEFFHSCDNKDDVIDVIHAVYRGAPGLEFCIHRDISVETRSRAIDAIVTQIQLIQGIKGLDTEEKASLIEQIKAQGQEDSTKIVEGIHALSNSEAQVIIDQLATTGLNIKNKGIVHSDMQKWNNDFAIWLRHSAESLNPGALLVRDASKETAAFERVSRRYNRLYNYDRSIKIVEQELIPEGKKLIGVMGDELRQANYPTREDFESSGVSRFEALLNFKQEVTDKRRKSALENHPDRIRMRLRRENASITEDEIERQIEEAGRKFQEVNGAFTRIENLYGESSNINDIEICHWLDQNRGNLAQAVPDRLAKLKAEREAYARGIDRDEADRFDHRCLPAPTLGKEKKFPVHEFGVRPFVRRGEDLRHRSTTNEAQREDLRHRSTNAAKQRLLTLLPEEAEESRDSN